MIWQRNGSQLLCRVKAVKSDLGFAALLTLILLPSLSFLYSMSDGFYLEVPYVRQAKNFCGPAALASVFRYWEHPADQHSLAAEVSPFPRKGLSGSQLKELAGKHNFAAYSFSGNRSVILEHLSKGRPLIIALTSSKLLNLNHYVVLVGWDEVRQEWVLHDPAEGAYRRVKAEELMHKWSDLDNWTLLVLPKTGK